MNIYQKLNMIQCSLKAHKGQNNSFGNYKYRSLEDINTALKPLLQEHGLVLILEDTIIEVAGRVYVKADATLINIDKPDEIIKTSASAREAQTKKGMDDSQITGATSSYARKYCLNGLFCIDDTKDADTMDNRVKPTKTIDKNQINQIIDMINSTNTDEMKFLSWIGAGRVQDIKSNSYNKAISALKAKAAA